MTRATLARSASPLTSPSMIEAMVRVRSQSSRLTPDSSSALTVSPTRIFSCCFAVDLSGNS